MSNADGSAKGANTPKVFGDEVTLGVSAIRMADWWQTTMEANCRVHGLPVLTRSQALLVTYMTLGERRPIRLAENLGVSRQAVHIVINQLVEMDILTLEADPSDGRARIADFSAKHSGMRPRYAALMAAVENKLRARIGQDDYDALRRVVLGDWSEVPLVSPSDLKQAIKDGGSRVMRAS